MADASIAAIAVASNVRSFVIQTNAIDLQEEEGIAHGDKGDRGSVSPPSRLPKRLQTSLSTMRHMGSEGSEGSEGSRAHNHDRKSRTQHQSTAIGLGAERSLVASTSMQSVEVSAPVSAKIGEIVNMWHLAAKLQQRNHMFASEFFQQKHNCLRVLMIILTVLLGSSAVVESGQTLQAAGVGAESAQSVQVVAAFMFVSIGLFILSLAHIILRTLADTVWRFQAKAQKHLIRSRVHGQFCLQCERVVAQMAMSSAASTDTFLEFYMSLMSTRANILDRQEILVFPPDTRIRLNKHTTPLFVPEMARITLRRKPSQHPAHTHGRRHNSRTPRRRPPPPPPPPPAPRLAALVRRVHKLARAEAQHGARAEAGTETEGEDQLEPSPSPSPSARRGSLQPTQERSSLGDVAAASDAYTQALQVWKKQAGHQCVRLARQAVLLHKKHRCWTLIKSIPSMFTTFASTITMAEETRRYTVAKQLAQQLGDPTVVLVGSIIVLCMLFLGGVADVVDTALAFQRRAHTTESHAKQLCNFKELVTTTIMNDYRASDATRASHLEELRQLRQDIRDEFPLLGDGFADGTTDGR